MTIDVLKTQLGFTHFTVKANADGVSQEDSLTCAPHGGSCFNWVLGHVVSARHGMLKMLGGESPWSDADRAPYARGQRPDAARALPVERLVADFDRAQEEIVSRLDRLSAVDLEAECPDVLTGKPSRLGIQLGALVFHESYHSGQLGVLRRVMNKPGAIQ